MEAKAINTWPGPVTWVLPASDRAPVWVTGKHQTIAVRVTAHPLAAAICRAAGSALVSTSANPAGRPSARNAMQTRLCMDDDGLMIIAGRTGELNQPTPIYDACSGVQLR
jgi:L-threonylcarbamoyladenylate synthase